MTLIQYIIVCYLHLLHLGCLMDNYGNSSLTLSIIYTPMNRDGRLTKKYLDQRALVKQLGTNFIFDQGPRTLKRDESESEPTIPGFAVCYVFFSWFVGQITCSIGQKNCPKQVVLDIFCLNKTHMIIETGDKTICKRQPIPYELET